MDFQTVVTVLNKLLLRKSPTSFNSSWILKHAPRCYRFICKKVRAEPLGGIDWDKVTHALDPNHQRLWRPKLRRKPRPYRNVHEVNLILNKYRSKLYVFIAPIDSVDRVTRDQVAIYLVRLAQAGNVLAKAEVVKLVRFTVDAWLDNHHHLSCWKGRDDEIRTHLEGCVRRYRYTGSFLNYVLRTLEYAGRGISPLFVRSLDDPIAPNARERRIERVVRDPETNEIGFYEPTNANVHV